jgi:hypothetical protein
MGNLL